MRKAFGHVREGLTAGYTFRMRPYKADSAEPAKDGEGDSPLPLKFVIPVSRTQALSLLNQGVSVLHTRRRDGVLRSGIEDAERCERIFRKRPQGARSEARAGPLRRRGGNIRSTASRTNTKQRRNAAPPQTKKNKKLNTKPLSRKAKGFSFVRDTGIEPVTSSVSGKRATAAPIALTKQLFCCEVRTGFEPAYTALQAAA